MSEWCVSNWSDLEEQIIKELARNNHVIIPEYTLFGFSPRIIECKRLALSSLGHKPSRDEELKSEIFELFQDGFIIPIDLCCTNFMKMMDEDNEPIHKFVSIPDLIFAYPNKEKIEIIPLDIKDNLDLLSDDIPFNQISAFNLKYLIGLSSYLQRCISFVENYYQKRSVINSGCFIIKKKESLESEEDYRTILSDFESYIESSLLSITRKYPLRFKEDQPTFKGISFLSEDPEPTFEKGVFFPEGDYFLESFQESELWSKLGKIQNKIDRSGYYGAFVSVCAGFLSDKRPIKRLDVDPFMGVEFFSPEILELKEELNYMDSLSLYDIKENFSEKIRAYIRDLGDAYILTLKSRIRRLSRSKESSQKKLVSLETEIEEIKLEDDSLSRIEDAKTELEFAKNKNLDSEYLKSLEQDILRKQERYLSGPILRKQKQYLDESRIYSDLDSRIQKTKLELSIAEAKRIELMNTLEPSVYFKFAQKIKEDELRRISSKIITLENAMVSEDKKLNFQKLTYTIAENFEKSVRSKAILELKSDYSKMKKKFNERYKRSIELTKKIDQFNNQTISPPIARDSFFPHPKEFFIQLNGTDFSSKTVYRIVRYSSLFLE